MRADDCSAMKRRLSLAVASLAGACTPLPSTAPPYHAVGTEPFWGLVIDENNLTFTQPDAAADPSATAEGDHRHRRGNLPDAADPT